MDGYPADNRGSAAHEKNIYVLKIYRHQEEGNDVGIIERVEDGKKTSFRTIKELGQILGMKQT